MFRALELISYAFHPNSDAHTAVPRVLGLISGMPKVSSQAPKQRTRMRERISRRRDFFPGCLRTRIRHAPTRLGYGPDEFERVWGKCSGCLRGRRIVLDKGRRDLSRARLVRCLPVPRLRRFLGGCFHGQRSPVPCLEMLKPRWLDAATVMRLAFLLAGLLLGLGNVLGKDTPPNVLLICADDLGWGDLSCYGAKALRTPHLDRLASQGLRFTDAHSPSATCTPSRYAMLTGEYAWRRRGTGVLPGDASLIIEPGRTTLPRLFQRAGYRTAVIGKWHLGLGTTNLDWNREIRPGPLEVGFDHAFIMAATGDRVPCVYVEDHRVVGLDPTDPIRVRYGQPLESVLTGKARPDLLRLRPSHGHDQTIIHGISRIGYMTGGSSALWRDETMAREFLGRTRRFLQRAAGRPFFLYLALHDPHVPRVPHPDFAGKSGLGPRGDAILQADWTVGEVLGELDRQGLGDTTLVIFTSDNGAVVDDGYQDGAKERLGTHAPNGPWRGGKYSKFEGGTRVPLIVRWPGRIQPGVSGALMSHVDFPVTLGALIRQMPEPATAPDSENHGDALLGDSGDGRRLLVEHGQGLALREGSWKYIEPAEGSSVAWQTGIETGNLRAPQLYDLAKDPGESLNLAEREPDRVRHMQDRLAEIRSR